MNLHEKINLNSVDSLDRLFCNYHVKVEECGDMVKIVVSKELFVANGFKFPSEITFWSDIKNFMYIKEVVLGYEFIFSNIPLDNMEAFLIERNVVTKPFGFWRTVINGLSLLTLEQTRKNVVEYISSNQNSPILTKK